MSSDKNRYNQFLGEMKFLNNYNKDYEFSIVDGIKVDFTLKSIDEYLESKQLTYNNTVAIIINKYGITADDLFKDLNQIWNSLSSDTAIDLIFDKMGMKNEAMKKGFNFALGCYGLNYKDLYAQMKWDYYKKRVYELVSQYVDEMLKSDD